MSGLECSEVKYSYAVNHSDVFRLDSFYYSQEFLDDERLLQNRKHQVLEKLQNTTLLSFGAYSLNNYVEYLSDGVPFIRCVDMKNGLIETENLIHISENAHKLLYKSEVFPETILLSMSGSVGNVALALQTWKYPINSNQDIAKIRLHGDMPPYYVYSFLKSKFGQNFMRREARGSVQQHVFLSQIEKIKIPVFSDDFYAKVEKFNQNGFSSNEKAKDIYHEAEHILLSTLGIDTFTPSSQNTAVKSFSASFAANHRIDAEYYQPKYEEIERKLDNFPQIKIKDLVSYPVSSGSTPKAGNQEYYTTDKAGIPFIRAVDIAKSRIETDNFIYIRPEVHNSLLRRTKLKKNDVLFSIAGTVGRCGLFDYDFEANINQAIAILRFSEVKIKRLYLVQFFNSSVGKLLVEKYARQGLQTNLNLEEVSELSIPIIDYDMQEKISTLIKKSFALREKSKALLARAVRAVEIAIEEDEAAAMKHLAGE